MPWMQLELFVCKSVALHELASFLLPEVEPEPDPLGLSPPEDLHPVSCEEYAAVADFIMLLNWVWREAGQGASRPSMHVVKAAYRLQISPPPVPNFIWQVGIPL